MHVLAISKEKFNQLEKYKLDKGIMSTEANLYFLDNKTNQKIIKVFHRNDGSYFGNKLLTINYT